MPRIAIFGIENGALNTVVSLLVLFLVALYLALVYWTYSDAKRRVGDSLVVACATVASFLFPFLGAIVYLILRPPEYIEDARERELEMAAAEMRLMQLHDQACPNCGYGVERSFLRCPNCQTRLKQPCTTCRKPLDPRWKVCPYCEAPVGQAPPPRRRRRDPAGDPATAQRPAAARAQPPAASSGTAPALDGAEAPARARQPEYGAPADRPAAPRSRPPAG